MKMVAAATTFIKKYGLGRVHLGHALKLGGALKARLKWGQNVETSERQNVRTSKRKKRV